MKNILVDLYKIKDLYSGLGQFSFAYAKELQKQVSNTTKLRFLVPPGSDFTTVGENTKNIKTSILKKYCPLLYGKQDVWHSLQQFPSFLPRKNTTHILTIHDLNFLVEKSETKKKKYLRRLQKNIDRADFITAISEYTKAQIKQSLDLKGKEITVIYNGIDNNQQLVKAKPDFMGSEKFFFSIGIFNEKKNFKCLVPLMKHFPDYTLVVSGNNDTAYGKSMQKEIQRQGLESQIILSGKVNPQEKKWLYSHCEAFLFPSLAEGFGMPVIEAMKEGRPVFISNKTSLPEIGGHMAFYLENFNAENMAGTIRSGLEVVSENKTKFVQDSRTYAQKFNWETCVSEYLKVYQKATE